MHPEETKQKLLRVFKENQSSLKNFREKYFFMRKIKMEFPKAPESLIYLVIDRVTKRYNYDENSEKFIEVFLSQIFPILSGKTEV